MSNWLLLAASVAAVVGAITVLPEPLCWWVSGAIGLLALAWQAWRSRPDPKLVAEFGGFRWDRQTFCRHWQITGTTGSGKTVSGVNQLLFQLFKNQPQFGALLIDEKGTLKETLVAMAAHFGRSDDVILLQVRPPEAAPDWTPRHRLNLTSDRTIPLATYARCVVDTAVAMGSRQEQSFFRRAGQILIEQGLAALVALDYEVTLENVHRLVTDLNELKGVVTALKARKETELARALQSFLDQPPEQRSGTVSSVANYLHSYTTPEIGEVFCRDSTFSLADIDRGKILCLALPQRFQVERRYLGTFLKQLFYLHVLRRFDLSKVERLDRNLLVLLMDEAQHVVRASEDGLSDHSLVDVVREAGAAVIAATQSTTSLIPTLGVEAAKVLGLNLRNRIIFTAADEDDARASAEFLGKEIIRERSVTRSEGKRSETWSEREEYRVKPHIMRALKAHHCILVHAERGYRRCVLPPLEPDGRVSPWFRRFRI